MKNSNFLILIFSFLIPFVFGCKEKMDEYVCRDLEVYIEGECVNLPNSYYLGNVGVTGSNLYYGFLEGVSTVSTPSPPLARNGNKHNKGPLPTTSLAPTPQNQTPPHIHSNLHNLHTQPRTLIRRRLEFQFRFRLERGAPSIPQPIHKLPKQSQPHSILQ